MPASAAPATPPSGTFAAGPAPFAPPSPGQAGAAASESETTHVFARPLLDGPVGGSTSEFPDQGIAAEEPGAPADDTASDRAGADVPSAGDTEHSGEAGKSVPAAGLIAAAGAMRSGRRAARKAAGEILDATSEQAVSPPNPDGGGVLETLKAAGLIDSQRAGGRRRAREAEGDGDVEGSADAVEHAGAEHASATHISAEHAGAAEHLDTAEHAGAAEHLAAAEHVDAAERASGAEEQVETVQWRVEAPGRLREEAAPPVSMFDSPSMVRPAGRGDDAAPSGLGAAFAKGPVIPTARVPEPPPTAEPPTGPAPASGPQPASAPTFVPGQFTGPEPHEAPGPQTSPEPRTSPEPAEGPVSPAAPESYAVPELPVLPELPELPELPRLPKLSLYPELPVLPESFAVPGQPTAPESSGAHEQPVPLESSGAHERPGPPESSGAPEPFSAPQPFSSPEPFSAQEPPGTPEPPVSPEPEPEPAPEAPAAPERDEPPTPPAPPTPLPDPVPEVPEPDQVPPVPVPGPVPPSPFGPSSFLGHADVEHDPDPYPPAGPGAAADRGAGADPTAHADPGAEEDPKVGPKSGEVVEPGEEPFVTAVVVGGRSIELPPLVEPTAPTSDSPSATRASRRPKSDLSLAELLAEALVAYETGRREDEAAQAGAGRGAEEHRDAESTGPIVPVGDLRTGPRTSPRTGPGTAPETDAETTAPLRRVTGEPPRWTLPES